MTSYGRAIYYPVTTPQSTAYTYSVSWTAASTWLIDGTTVRTLYYADALGDASYPQTLMRPKLGICASGDSDTPRAQSAGLAVRRTTATRRLL
jgi:hypothetical protein